MIISLFPLSAAPLELAPAATVPDVEAPIAVADIPAALRDLTPTAWIDLAARQPLRRALAEVIAWQSGGDVAELERHIERLAHLHARQPKGQTHVR